MRLYLILAICLTAGSRPAIAADTTPRSVLILDQSDISGPLVHEMLDAIVRVFDSAPSAPVTVYFESLDLGRFAAPEYEISLRQHFLTKYRDKKIGVVMPIGDASLEFTMRHRAELWPDRPVVFTRVNEATVARLDPPPEVTGVTMKLRSSDIVAAAKLMVSPLEKVAFVGDAWKTQRAYRHLKDEFTDEIKGLEIIDLAGLPMRELLTRIAVLPKHTAIIYSAIYSDGEGNFYPPIHALDLVSKAANRPIVVFFETYLGHGAVGGFVLMPSLFGKLAAQLSLQILDGQNVESIPIRVGDAVRPVFDWRQMQRWQVSEESLPPQSEIRFREQNIWEQYRWQILSTFTIVLFQSLVITGLIVERYRRRAAEEESRQRIRQVIHLNRTATAGALSASVAHELNQPLGAILNYAETAELLLANDVVNLPHLKEIIADIRRDDQRASEIIKHLRGLLKQKSETDLQTFDLNEALNSASRILEPEAVRRGIGLDTVRSGRSFPVRADQVQLEQVVMNLVTNAMDAVSDCPPSRRRLVVQAVTSGEFDVEVMVSDSGPGVSEASLSRIFESFYTTKPDGTGLGLSICRTIVEAYGGRIWAENRAGGGAVFRFTVPLARTAAPALV